MRDLFLGSWLSLTLHYYAYCIEVQAGSLGVSGMLMRGPALTHADLQEHASRKSNHLGWRVPVSSPSTWQKLRNYGLR